MKRVAIIGYSGHAYVVLDACRRSNVDVAYYCAPKPTVFDPYGLTYLGDEAAEDFDWSLIDAFLLGIGDNHIRAKVAQKIKEKGKHLLNVVHPTSVVSSSVQFDQGNFFAAGSVFNPLVTIGNSCVVNTGAIVEHECVLGNYVHIAPGAVLAGNVHVGDYSFVGANAVIKQGTKVGTDVTIGAGSVVLRDVPNGEIWVGNPAKILKK